jgi:hypothetical protein
MRAQCIRWPHARASSLTLAPRCVSVYVCVPGAYVCKFVCQVCVCACLCAMCVCVCVCLCARCVCA